MADDLAAAAPQAVDPNAAAPATTDSGSPNMTMLVSKNGGQPFPISSAGLMNTMRAPPEQGGAGLTNIVGMSQDGSRLHIADPVAGPPGDDGQQPTRTRDMHIQTAAKALGLDIKSVTPANADTDPDNISTYLSGVIPTMATDTEKHNFISNHLKNQGGFADPRVVGSGNDWYNYEPDTQQWYQVAKSPSFKDGSGYLNAALNVPQMVGAGVAGGAGATAGIGAGAGVGSIPLGIAGGAAGGAAGSALGQGLTKAGLAAYDPDYRNALNGSEELNSVGKNAMLDGAVMGVAGPLGKAIGPIAKGLGAVGEGLGSVTEGIGKFIQKPAVSEFIANSAPNPIGGLTQAAEAPQLAQNAVTGVPKAMQWLADSPIGKRVLSEEQRAALGGKGADLLQYGDTAAGVGKAVEVGSKQSAMQAAEDEALASGNASRIPATEEQQMSNQAAQEYGKYAGLPDEDIQWIQNEMSKGLPGGEAGAWRGAAEAMPPGPLEGIGGGLDTLAGIGNKITAPFSAAVRAGGAGIQGTGALMSAAGAATPAVGAAAQYYGLPEAGAKVRDYLLKRIQEDRDKHSMLPSR